MKIKKHWYFYWLMLKWLRVVINSEVLIWKIKGLFI
jgi:hypothetical protein